MSIFNLNYLKLIFLDRSRDEDKEVGRACE